MRDGLGRKLLASLVPGVIVALLVTMVAVLLLGRPPKTFALAAGQPGGMYASFASSLKDSLATDGINVEIIETAGSIENAELLRTGNADVGLIQSGAEYLTDIGGSAALAELFYEPFWIFARQGAIEVVDDIPVGQDGHALPAAHPPLVRDQKGGVPHRRAGRCRCACDGQGQ
jgi:TRAP-type uncharacterized transport system substrate-binding protein